MGLEVAEQFGWKLPDVIIYPTGGGTGLVGMWRAFEELEKIGWSAGRKPRMVCVQAERCAPIVKAFRKGKDSAKPWKDASTIAAGIRVPAAIADFIMLRVLRECHREPLKAACVPSDPIAGLPSLDPGCTGAPLHRSFLTSIPNTRVPKMLPHVVAPPPGVHPRNVDRTLALHKPHHPFVNAVHEWETLKHSRNCQTLGVLQQSWRVYFVTNGAAVVVSDAELLDGVRLLAKSEGIFASPEGGATVAALRRLREQGWIGKDERVVLFNTGSGFKYLQAFDAKLEAVERGFWQKPRAVD